MANITVYKNGKRYTFKGAKYKAYKGKNYGRKRYYRKWNDFYDPELDTVYSDDKKDPFYVDESRDRFSGRDIEAINTIMDIPRESDEWDYDKFYSDFLLLTQDREVLRQEMELEERQAYIKELQTRALELIRQGVVFTSKLTQDEILKVTSALTGDVISEIEDEINKLSQRMANMYYKYMPFHHMGFFANVAFVIPDFWWVDNVITHSIWDSYPELRNRYMVITTSKKAQMRPELAKLSNWAEGMFNSYYTPIINRLIMNYGAQYTNVNIPVPRFKDVYRTVVTQTMIETPLTGYGGGLTPIKPDVVQHFDNIDMFQGYALTAVAAKFVGISLPLLLGAKILYDIGSAFYRSATNDMYFSCLYPLMTSNVFAPYQTTIKPPFNNIQEVVNMNKNPRVAFEKGFVRRYGVRNVWTYVANNHGLGLKGLRHLLPSGRYLTEYARLDIENTDFKSHEQLLNYHNAYPAYNMITSVQEQWQSQWSALSSGNYQIAIPFYLNDPAYDPFQAHGYPRGVIGSALKLEALGAYAIDDGALGLLIHNITKDPQETEFQVELLEELLDEIDPKHVDDSGGESVPPPLEASLIEQIKESIETEPEGS